QVSAASGQQSTRTTSVHSVLLVLTTSHEVESPIALLLSSLLVRKLQLLQLLSELSRRVCVAGGKHHKSKRVSIGSLDHRSVCALTALVCDDVPDCRDAARSSLASSRSCSSFLRSSASLSRSCLTSSWSSFQSVSPFAR